MSLILVPQATDGLTFTHYELSRIITHLPVFFVGVIIADMEANPKSRPLDALRDLSIWWKIPINLILLFLFVTYGSFGGNDRCV